MPKAAMVSIQKDPVESLLISLRSDMATCIQLLSEKTRATLSDDLRSEVHEGFRHLESRLEKIERMIKARSSG